MSESFDCPSLDSLRRMLARLGQFLAAGQWEHALPIGAANPPQTLKTAFPVRRLLGDGGPKLRSPALATRSLFRMPRGAPELGHRAQPSVFRNPFAGLFG